MIEQHRLCVEEIEGKVKALGWQKILETDDNIQQYRFAAGRWETCAIGEVLGFTNSDEADGAAMHLPYDVREAGHAFAHFIIHGKKKQALACLRDIVYRREDIKDAHERYKQSIPEEYHNV